MVAPVRGPGAEYARVRLGVDDPKIGLLSNGEEPGKGDELRKAAHELLGDVPGFVGNVEGRDFMQPGVDVIVTDGFTGNVALKSIEGAIRATAKLVFDALAAPGLESAASEVMPHLLEAADPDRSRPRGRRGAARGRRRVRGVARVVGRDRGRELDCSRRRMCGAARRRIARRRPCNMPAETHVESTPIGPDEVFGLIRERLSEILEIDEAKITLDSSFSDDLDADSLALIELVEALEQELGERTVGFSIDDDDLGDLRTVRDAADYVVARLGQSG